MVYPNNTQRNRTKIRSIFQMTGRNFLICCLLLITLIISFISIDTTMSIIEKNNSNKLLQQLDKVSLEIEETDYINTKDNQTAAHDSKFSKVSEYKENSNGAISSPYSYVWIVGSIHEDRSAYRGFIWAVLISVNILRKEGSTADFWLLVRLAPDSKNETMPAEDERVLKALGVNIQYLEKPEIESFGQLVFDKFLTINMTDYKRVMFLDADILPLTNLDFFFHLSDPDSKDFPTILKPNLIYATRGEPCNTGFFVVEPNTQIYKEYKAAVKAQREYAEKHLARKQNKLTDFFDPRTGWGYDFQANNDQWEAVVAKSNRWRFHAVHSDQGLMYYVAKFLYKDVSIVIGHKVQNWKGVNGELRPEKESETMGQLEKYQPKLLNTKNYCRQSYEDAQKRNITPQYDCAPPYSSWKHFFGSTKPWQNSFNLKQMNRNSKTPQNIWFSELIELNEKLEIGLELEQWDTKYLPAMKESPLGYLARYADQGNTKK
jgi:hypothetical protein